MCPFPPKDPSFYSSFDVAVDVRLLEQAWSDVTSTLAAALLSNAFADEGFYFCHDLFHIDAGDHFWFGLQPFHPYFSVTFPARLIAFPDEPSVSGVHDDDIAHRTGLFAQTGKAAGIEHIQFRKYELEYVGTQRVPHGWWASMCRYCILMYDKTNGRYCLG